MNLVLLRKPNLFNALIVENGLKFHLSPKAKDVKRVKWNTEKHGTELGNLEKFDFHLCETLNNTRYLRI